MTYDTWIAEVQKMYGAGFGQAQQLYSFRAAFEDGLTPRRAVRDCKGWLAA